MEQSGKQTKTAGRETLAGGGGGNRASFVLQNKRHMALDHNPHKSAAPDTLPLPPGTGEGRAAPLVDVSEVTSETLVWEVAPVLHSDRKN